MAKVKGERPQKKMSKRGILGEGRPSVYRKEMDAILEAELARGMTIEASAPALGICSDRIFEWTNPESPTFKPSFSEAMKRGKDKCFEHFAKIGENMMGKGSAAVWIFQMKNRFHWADKTEVKHEGEIAVIDLTANDDEFGSDDDAI